MDRFCFAYKYVAYDACNMYYGRNRNMLLNKLSNTITNMRKNRISYKDRFHIIICNFYNLSIINHIRCYKK